MASSQTIVGVPITRPAYAGLGRRIVAHLIDVLVAFAVMLAAGFIMRGLRTAGLWTPLGNLDAVETWRGLAVSAKIAVIAAYLISTGPVYSALFEASSWQASIGKRLMHIYVTDKAGKRLGLARSLGRSFGKRIFNLVYLVLVSVITIAVTTEHQAVHDYAARTLVFRGRPSAAGRLELWRPVTAFGIQLVWFIATFLAVIPRVQQ